MTALRDVDDIAVGERRVLRAIAARERRDVVLGPRSAVHDLHVAEVRPLLGTAGVIDCSYERRIILQRDRPGLRERAFTPRVRDLCRVRGRIRLRAVDRDAHGTKQKLDSVHRVLVKLL